jgi:isopentenyl phosphate kinase
MECIIVQRNHGVGTFPHLAINKRGCEEQGQEGRRNKSSVALTQPLMQHHDMLYVNMKRNK